MKILIVEDDLPNRELLIDYLEHEKCEVDYAVDGVDAYRLIEKNMEKYDILITDYRMPKMSGLSLSRKVREILPKLPIIMYTGDPTVRLDATAPVSLLVRKPIPWQDFYKIIKGVVYDDNH